VSKSDSRNHHKELGVHTKRATSTYAILKEVRLRGFVNSNDEANERVTVSRSAENRMVRDMAGSISTSRR